MIKNDIDMMTPTAKWVSNGMMASALDYCWLKPTLFSELWLWLCFLWHGVTSDLLHKDKDDRRDEAQDIGHLITWSVWTGWQHREFSILTFVANHSETWRSHNSGGWQNICSDKWQADKNKAWRFLKFKLDENNFSSISDWFFTSFSNWHPI